MKNAPCRDCPEKGCGKKHDTCEAYQKWAQDKIRVKHLMGAEASVDSVIIASVRRAKRRIQ